MILCIESRLRFWTCATHREPVSDFGNTTEGEDYSIDGFSEVLLGTRNTTTREIPIKLQLLLRNVMVTHARNLSIFQAASALS